MKKYYWWKLNILTRNFFLSILIIKLTQNLHMFYYYIDRYRCIDMLNVFFLWQEMINIEREKKFKKKDCEPLQDF
jgi:hypothetical protein